MKAIQVHDVAKRFKIYYDRNRTLKERLLFRKRNRYDERWVLKDISFDIEQGEAVGLVGENGCGKSTTLKLLSRILFPDRGTISVNGRVSCLIELGAGFHPDMNGIENIYLNAAMFGVGRKETSKRLDRIIAFSELEPFIENPIRTYSSGMYMRLAFSVAINVDADVLLIDEILAVGDMNFQEKCLARLREIKERGATIVIVSHSLGQIEAFCDRSIWIDGGRVRADGAPAETHARYAAFMNGKKSQ
ncbi:ABC transporter, ATP-binding protein [Pyramidobacter piscolens W5455]|uniref:ABC transporter, ATP-binding protein n=1 Tax=Pyramidobacter piscolens W5455 TaxID=352165 RepID=A0ABM9ZRZ9_9BACT|nr:ABC transporter ATP-binding protein [Pyramidobacter piscolens]EFB89638.1 ABC transporter, ATP-binding protein [Pyramidobacter piscolens W5455]